MSRVWTQDISVQVLTDLHVGTAVAHLGIEFLEVGDDFITARVPVDTRTKQPYGLLHGGVSVVLADQGRHPRLGHRDHTPGAHRPQHPGVADRAEERRR